MNILNEGAESAKQDLLGIVDQLQERRAEATAEFEQLVLARRALLALESRRLAKRLGPEASRVKHLAARLELYGEIANQLVVEEEIAHVRTPRVAAEDVVVQGRMMTEDQRGVAGATLQLVDAQGKPVAEVPPVETDDAGYYAFVMTPEVAKTVAAAGTVSVAVGLEKPVVPEGVKPIAVAPGTRVTVETRLNLDVVHALAPNLRLNSALAAAFAGRVRMSEAALSSTGFASVGPLGTSGPAKKPKAPKK